MRIILIATLFAAAFTLQACSDAAAPSGLSRCDGLEVLHEASFSLTPAPAANQQQRLEDAASSGETLALLVSTMMDVASSPRYELWLHDSQTGARRSLRHLDPPADCFLYSLAFDSTGTLLFLAACGEKNSSEWRIYAQGSRGFVRRHTVVGLAPQLFGYDAASDRFCFFDMGSLYAATATSADLSPRAVGSAPSWGPTSGLDCSMGMTFFVRDAFEGGMENQLGMEQEPVDCLVDIERVEGLEGQPALKVATSEDGKIWIIAPSGAVARFAWARSANRP